MSKRIITSLVILGILIFSTLFTLRSYEFMDSATNKAMNDRIIHVEDYVGNSIEIDKAMYALEYLVSGEKNFTATLTNQEMSSEEIQEIINTTILENWISPLNDEPNVHYVAINNKTGKTLSNQTDLSIKNLEESKEYYTYYAIMNFSSDGKYSVEASSGNDDFAWRFDKVHVEKVSNDLTREVVNELNNKSTKYIMEDDEVMSSESSTEVVDSNEIVVSQINIDKIRDMTFIFAVPKQLVAEGQLHYLLSEGLNYTFEGYAVFYALVISCVVFLLALLIPATAMKKWGWYNSFMRVKFELVTPVIVFGLLILGRIGIYTAYITVFYGLEDTINHFGIFEYTTSIEILINFIVWLVYYILVLISGLIARYILHVGFKKYVVENTLLFSIIKYSSYFYKKISRAIRALFFVDLRYKSQRKLLSLVILNSLFVSVLVSVFGFNAIIAIIYSLILYRLIYSNIYRVQKDYEKLLDTVTKISKTDFNVLVNEDLGSFDSIREKLEDLKEGFENAINEEVKSQNMKTELITNVSHDLKTPLTSIISYVELLKDEEDSEKRQEYVQTIDRNAQRLKNLINDLFEISKVNSGNVSVDYIEMDVVSLLRQVLAECQKRLDEANLIVRVNSVYEKCIVELDSLKTYRIFENLIINICKYALDNTRVFIDIDETSDYVVITMKNISKVEIEADKQDVTERFVRGDKSRNTEGSGLGLAIVKSFVELQEGVFKVEVDGDLFKAILKFKKQRVNHEE